MQLIAKCERHLNVPLNEEEKAEESRKLMSQLDDFDTLEKQSKESAKTFKESMYAAWSDISHTRNIIKNGPVKLVKCHEFLDEKQGKVFTIRTDTGEEVGSRTAEEEDYQTKLEITFTDKEVRQVV